MNRLRRHYVPLLAILLLAFVLRMATIETRPLWYDDAFSVLLAERGPAAIASGTAADTMPPGYYLLLYAWMSAFGQTPLATRMLSVSLSLLIVALVFAIGARGFGRRTGSWAAFLIALMPFQIYHAQELRMYTLLAVGVCLYLYGLMGLALLERSVGFQPPRGDGDPKSSNRLDIRFWRALGLIAVGTAVALYAHNLAFVSLLAGNLYLAIQALRGKLSWGLEGRLIVAQLLGALAFAPWLVYLPTQLEKIQRAFWTRTPGLLDLVQMLMVFVTYLPLPPPGIAAALFVSIAILVLAAWQLLKIARRQALPALGLLVTFVLVPPLLLFVLSYLMRPVFVPRGAIGSAVALTVVLAVVAARVPRSAQFGVGLFALLVAGLLLPFYYSAYGEWRRAPYAEADARLRAQWRDGDVILHDNKLSYFPMHLYDRDLPQSFLADPPQSDNDTLAPASQAAMNLLPTAVDAALGNSKRVWFVIYATAVQEALHSGQPHPNLARLDAHMQRVQESDYGDLRIVLYAPR